MSDADKPLQTPGEILRQARESADISEREMADRLHWMPSHVGAIEENRFDELRGTAFVRGYLRTYGKMLGVSEQALLFAFDAMTLPEQASESDSTTASQETLWQRPGVGVALGIGAALLLASLFWLLQDDVDLPGATSARQTPPLQAEEEAVLPPPELPTHVSDAPALEPEPEPADVDTLEPTESQLPEQRLPERGLPEQGPELEPESEPEQKQEPEAMGLADEPSVDQPAAEIQPVPLTAVPIDAALLQFTFSGECWLEVRDADGAFYANLLQPGDVLGLNGQPPFNVLVGDAHQVLLKYRGEDFDIRTRPGRTVARFSVGDP
jgi:cytoskeleton protein RodZ